MSQNITITQSPVVLFLGAGASVPLGKPIMKQFIERLAEQVKSEDDARLLSFLISARGYDLELIMGDLETLLSLDYVSSFVFDSEPAYEANRNDAAHLRSFIRHSMIREFRTIDNKRVVDVYQPLFNTIFSHIDPTTHCLPIFTTNYDLAIEKFCQEQPYPHQYDLVDGMEEDSLERETFWNPREFESFCIKPNLKNPEFEKALDELAKTLLSSIVGPHQPQQRKIVLFKLHGSVNWMRVASTGKIVQSLPMYDVVDSDEYQNAIIYPAGNKVATLEPYLTSYHYFSRCCDHARLIIVIGYSFHDYDALSSLLKARQVNDKLTLLLLSPDAYTVLKTIPDEDRVYWTHAVYGLFGDTGSEVEYLAEIDGWLARSLENDRHD